MISRYHHLRFGESRFHMSDIVAGASHEFERVVPSAGLTNEQIGAAFRHVRLAALHYDLEKVDDAQRSLIVTSYLNSGMPLGLGTPNHLTALIGGGFDENGFYGVCSDDEIGPYCRKTANGSTSKKWDALFVPLPERIYLRAEEADEIGQVQLQKVLDHEKAQRTRELFADRRIGTRCFAVEAREHKRLLRGRGACVPPAVLAEHLAVSGHRDGFGSPRSLTEMPRSAGRMACSESSPSTLRAASTPPGFCLRICPGSACAGGAAAPPMSRPI